MIEAAKRCLPWTVLVLGVVYLGVAAWPADMGGGEFHLKQFAGLPVSSGGRVKPIDSAARANLMRFSGKQRLSEAAGLSSAEEGEQPAVKWLLNVLSRPNEARQLPVFRVDHPDLLGMLGVKPGERKYFSFSELRVHGSTLQRQARQASELDASNRDPYQRAVVRVFSHMNRYMALSRLKEPYIVPPRSPNEAWQQFMQAHQQAPGAAGGGSEADRAVRAYSSILMAWREQNPSKFNATVADYRSYLDNLIPGEMRRARVELFFNQLQPFYRATVLYVGIFVLGCLSWLVCPAPLRRAAVWLAVLTVMLHTLGLATRVYLQGRPPVTNLYSSAVFIGWGCVLLGLALEWAYRNALGIVTAAVIGCATLIVAHNLASGDTMEMMQAVLDTNFWLATHVIAITIGYSATFFADLLGIIFICRGVLTRTLTPQQRQEMGRMIYGVVCFALLFSFVGTVLGGIWADQSWGRFWGWDPKENGAALIVLMNALILHARWGGLVRERGVAVLAIGGNIVTSWSWFGTNLLGVGLHSYGFMDSGVFWLGLFVFSQFVFIAMGLLPPHFWRSNAFERVRPGRTMAGGA
jgi:ABC-type transport system involved in cytochrome c biogenesis permease subunit